MGARHRDVGQVGDVGEVGHAAGDADEGAVGFAGDQDEVGVAHHRRHPLAVVGRAPLAQAGGAVHLQHLVQVQGGALHPLNRPAHEESPIGCAPRRGG